MSQPLLKVVHQLRNLVGKGTEDQCSDGDLLNRFIKNQDQQAFLTLMRRHGPMVLGVCRRASLSEHDAEDAYQAVFIVLVRRAATLDGSGSIANWLYGVAWKTAVKARSRSLKRRDREKVVQEVEATAREETPKSQWSELKPLLDEEVSRLPEKYRTPFVLCYLQGKTNAEAANEMGCPQGTVFTRLSRARDLLRAKLERRGIALGATGLAALLVPENVSASVPAEFAARFAILQGTVAAGEAAQSLAEGVVQDMVWSRVRTTAVALLALGLAGTGLTWALQAPNAPIPPATVSQNSPPNEPKPEVLQLGKADPKAGRDVLSVAYAPDGKSVISGSHDGIIKKWDTRSGKEIRQFVGHAKGLIAVAVSPDGTTLASVSQDRTLRFWDIATGQETRKIATSGETAVAYSPDGKILATASLDMHVQLYDAATGQKMYALERAPGFVWSLAFSADQKWLASCAYDPVLTAAGPPLPEEILPVDPKIQTWDLAKRQSRFQLTAEAMSLAFSPDSRALVSVNPGTSGYLWEMATGQVRCRFSDKNGMTRTTAYSPDGRWLAMSDGNFVTLWDAWTGKRVHTLKRHASWVNCLAFSPDGKSLASGSTDATTILWDLPPVERAEAPLPLARIEEAWRDLGSASAESAFQAMAQLNSSPRESVEFLASRMAYPKHSQIGEDQVKIWVKDLDNSDYGVRERADASLRACGAGIQNILRAILKSDVSPEQRRRLQNMLDGWARCVHTPAELQILRGLEVLERIGTPQAVEVVQKFSEMPGPLQEDAKSTLARLRKKS